MLKTIEVVAAIIERDGQILLAQRPEQGARDRGAHQRVEIAGGVLRGVGTQVDVDGGARVLIEEQQVANVGADGVEARRQSFGGRDGKTDFHGRRSWRKRMKGESTRVYSICQLC